MILDDLELLILLLIFPFINDQLIFIGRIWIIRSPKGQAHTLVKSTHNFINEFLLELLLNFSRNRLYFPYLVYASVVWVLDDWSSGLTLLSFGIHHHIAKGFDVESVLLLCCLYLPNLVHVFCSKIGPQFSALLA